MHLQRSVKHSFLTTALVGVLFGGLCICRLGAVFAAPGDLDTTFAGTGITRTGAGNGADEGNAVAVQADGKIVVAGTSFNLFANEFSVVRYNTDGSLDTTFDGDGKVLTAISTFVSPIDVGKAVALQPDGKIIVAGDSRDNIGNDFALVRYNQDGSLDTSFSDDGKVITSIAPADDFCNAVSVQADGKIVAAGYARIGVVDDFAVVRYNVDGSLDTTFNGTGIVTTPIGASTDQANAMAVQPDGKLVVAGTALISGTSYDFAVVRYNMDGTLDTSFNGTGIVTTPIIGGAGSDAARALTFQVSSTQPLLKIVAAGQSGSDTNYYFAVARYNENGSLDTSFDGDGTLLLSTSAGFEGATAGAIQTGMMAQPSRILVGGYSHNGSNLDFAVVRLFLNGSLDTSFDGDGLAVTDFFNGQDNGNAMALQADKIVAAGARGSSSFPPNFAVARYNLTDGSLDTSFSVDGKRVDDIGSLIASANSVAMQADGKIVVAGAVNHSSSFSFQDFAIARYNVDGSLDTSFTGGGRQVITTGTDFEGKAVAIQADGKIVVAGSVFQNGDYDFAVVRLNTNGLLDTSFDADGLVVTHISSNDSADAIAIQADGKIVVAGSADNSSRVAVVRYNADSSLDTSFSSDGIVTTPIFTIGKAVAIQADGKIIVAGHAFTGATDDFAVVRYNADGSLDTSFNGTGRVTTPIGTGEDIGNAVAIQADGRIVVAGYSDSDSTSGINYDFALVRYNADGSLDTSFDGDGTVVTPTGSGTDIGNALAIEADGKIIVAGYSFNAISDDFAAVCYNTNGSLDFSYGNLGKVLVDVSNGGNDSGNGLALDATGKAVVAGTSAGFFGVVRLLDSDGSIWTGAISSDWSTAGNWISNSAPTASDGALLPATGVTNEAVLITDVSIDTLVIEAGRSLTINAGNTLTINGTFVLNGTITGGGTLLFNGTNFINNNFISNVNVHFGTGVKQLYGTGLFLDNTVTVLPGSTLQLTSNHLMNRLVVDSGGTLDIPSGKTVSLLGSGVVLTSIGSLTGTGAISFDGTSAQTTSGTVAFGGLTINNAAGVTLGADATVNATLSLMNGDLNTGAFTLTMPATAISTGTTDVVGNVKRTGFTTANTLSFGNPFNTIRFTSGTPPIDVTVNLVKQARADFPNSVRRAFTITPTGGSGFAATLRLHYLDSELNGNAEATLGLWRKSASWANLGATTRNATDNWVELAGLGQFSPWVISGPAAPTAVEFAGANVTQFDDGTLIEWQTGFEVSNLGFNIYQDEYGRRTLVNPQLIAGSALLAGADTQLTAGKSYAWLDKRTANKDIAYWLEDVDTNGSSTWHGPFFPTEVAGPIPEHKTHRSNLLSALGESRGRDQTASKPLETAASLPRTNVRSSLLQETIATGEGVKLAIKVEGWYRVTREELFAAGLARDVEPQNLQLFVDGLEQPILVVDKEPDSDASFEAIEFYAVGTDSPYSDARTYWLVPGRQTGRRVPVINTRPASKGAQSFPFTVELKERSIYFSALLNGDSENWFGGVITPQGIAQPIAMRSLDQASQEKAELEIALQGVTTLAATPDHQVQVRVNDQLVGHVFFDGREHKVSRFSVPLWTLKEGENLVTLATGSPADISLVDRIRLTYPRKYIADRDALKLGTTGGFTSQRVDGFTSGQIRVFDVSDAAEVRELTGVIERIGEGNFSVAVDAQVTNRTLLALTPSHFKKPESITANRFTSLRSEDNSADFVIVSRREWIYEMEPLKALRQKQGLVTVIVDLEDIFDEFSFGQKTPYAVRDFLSYASVNWKRKPQWVLLAGDASFDPRDYAGRGATDFVPTKLVDTAFLETGSDDWLADFNGDALTELAIGRLPIRSAEDATTMVAKLLNYELAPPSPEMVLFADLNDGFDFESASKRLGELVSSSLYVNDIFRSRNSDAATKAKLLEALNRGQKIVNSVGHGSATTWRGNMLTTHDARVLNNSSRLGLFLMMNCLNGYFLDPLNESIAEGLMRNEHGGAIAVWASSGMTFPNEQALMNQQLYRTMFGKTDLTLGEHVRFAKLATSDADVQRSWILLGDPTIKLK